MQVSFYSDNSKALSFTKNNIIYILLTSTYAKRSFSPLQSACDHFHIANTT